MRLTSCLPSAMAGSWVSPPNITCAMRFSWSSMARVQLRVVVAVDHAPPGRHAVDQLATVLQPDAHAARRRHLVGRQRRPSWTCRGARGDRDRRRFMGRSMPARPSGRSIPAPPPMKTRRTKPLPCFRARLVPSTAPLTLATAISTATSQSSSSWLPNHSERPGVGRHVQHPRAGGRMQEVEAVEADQQKHEEAAGARTEEAVVEAHGAEQRRGQQGAAAGDSERRVGGAQILAPDHVDEHDGEHHRHQRPEDLPAAPAWPRAHRRERRERPPAPVAAASARESARPGRSAAPRCRCRRYWRTCWSRAGSLAGWTDRL